MTDNVAVRTGRLEKAKRRVRGSRADGRFKRSGVNPQPDRHETARWLERAAARTRRVA